MPDKDRPYDYQWDMYYDEFEDADEDEIKRFTDMDSFWDSLMADIED